MASADVTTEAVKETLASTTADKSMALAGTGDGGSAGSAAADCGATDGVAAGAACAGTSLDSITTLSNSIVAKSRGISMAACGRTYIGFLNECFQRNKVEVNDCK